MSNLIISVEATCDLPHSFFEGKNIAVAEMEFTVGNDVYNSLNGLPAIECFKRMRAGALTRTSLINEYSATEHLDKLLSEGNDVIHIGFSSTLSGTFANFAKAAEILKKKYPQRKLAVIDSLCGSASQGILALETEKAVAGGATFEQAVEFVKANAPLMCHTFVADDLTYLARSGRISKIVALFGNAINLKPIMYLGKDGKFAVLKKVMTRRKSVLSLADSVIENYSGKFKDIIVLHADCAEEAALFADRIEAKLGVKPIITDFGMVIGSHCGPGTLGVFYSGKNRGK